MQYGSLPSSVFFPDYWIWRAPLQRKLSLPFALSHWTRHILSRLFCACPLSKGVVSHLTHALGVTRKRLYRNHPDVHFKPGPFYMGDGLLGWAANLTCIFWTMFVCVIFCIPTELPVTKTNMNYASVCSFLRPTCLVLTTCPIY